MGVSVFVAAAFAFLVAALAVAVAFAMAAAFAFLLVAAAFPLAVAVVLLRRKVFAVQALGQFLVGGCAHALHPAGEMQGLARHRMRPTTSSSSWTLPSMAKALIGRSIL